DEEIKGRPAHNMIIDNAFVVMISNIRSRCCVLEIYIPECSDTVHVLEAYRHGRLLLRFPDGTDTYKTLDSYTITTMNEEIDTLKKTEQFMELDEFFSMLSITPLALRRSAVFAYGKHDRQEYVNCLANEEGPKDGSVSGKLKYKVENEDRSQYKGIETYASAVTLLEIIEETGLSLADRISYQTTEIFFIEMLLIRDASTDDIMQKLYNVSELISEGLISGKKARKQLEKIHQNLSNAITFTGTTQYLWPTVQESVKLLSKDFDLEDIERRYKEAENVIEDKIDALVRKDELEAQKRNERNDRVKNFFLFALTLFGWISAVKEGLELFQDMNPITIISIALVITAIFAYLAYFFYRKKKDDITDDD
ncbi:MAG: hypothetical protein MJ171_05235, partial [Clostridia bacterium]|nr:hypothetical protein [Clostridia bacterium]